MNYIAKLAVVIVFTVKIERLFMAPDFLMET